VKSPKQKSPLPVNGQRHHAGRGRLTIFLSAADSATIRKTLSTAPFENPTKPRSLIDASALLETRAEDANGRYESNLRKAWVAVFRHACKLGLEGIVSKRRDSPYRSGRSPDWLKVKNPACEAVRREEEEDWGKDRR
jgi:hypothetical protein